MRKYIVGVVLALASLSAYAGGGYPAQLNFCTGGQGGFYEGLGATIGQTIVRTLKQGNVKLNLINTGGSVESAQLLKDGDCDIAILQADAVASLPMPQDIKVSDAHTEMAYWLHSSVGTSDFGNLENDVVAKRFAVATVVGSGAGVTIRNFIKTDKDYEGVRIVEFDDWYSAAEAVAQGYTVRAGLRLEIGGMLYIGRPGFLPSDIVEDFSKQLLIGEVNDSSFADSKDVNGNALYTKCEIDSKQYAGLKSSNSWKDPKTYCMKAQIVYNNDWHKNLDPATGREVRRAVDRGINSIVKAVR